MPPRTSSPPQALPFHPPPTSLAPSISFPLLSKARRPTPSLASVLRTALTLLVSCLVKR
ncbi:hypothetical protein E2C01_079517 [Portunus trituberculatus]|uniref:Uncharacterized protein n=1 Tax=Portunus trituberculatus TaxID=210409 RepID=A0A5B7IVU7_PORTR|nr:hypothetical protein [Portunus trituberculatus]